MEKAKDTKKQIMKGAMAAFEKKGFSASTIKEIAKASHVAEGTIYKYYNSKEALLETVADELVVGLQEKDMMASMLNKLEEMPVTTIESQLKVIFMTCLNELEPYILHIKVLMPEVRYSATIRNMLFETIICDVINMLDRLLDEAKERGEVRNLSNFTVSRTLAGGILLLFLQKQHMPAITKQLDVEKEMDSILDMMMSGIKNKELEN
jgi:AcrR family transcriptional regulator